MLKFDEILVINSLIDAEFHNDSEYSLKSKICLFYRRQKFKLLNQKNRHVAHHSKPFFAMKNLGLRKLLKNGRKTRFFEKS